MEKIQKWDGCLLLSKSHLERVPIVCCAVQKHTDEINVDGLKNFKKLESWTIKKMEEIVKLINWKVDFFFFI